MINSNDFQQAAKKFRAGRISLKEFTDLVITGSPKHKRDQKTESESKTTNSSDAGPDAGQSRLTRLPQRQIQSHKGDFGRVLAIGGSDGMGGAIGMAGFAALRSGSGLVKVAVPKMVQNFVSALNPGLMTIGCVAEGSFFHGASEDVLSHHSNWADVVALGPGMGRGEAQKWIVKKLYAEIGQPMVVDADGLNALADQESDLAVHDGQRILTPHPGEFQRLAKTKITNRPQMEAAATEMALAANVVVVLKGNQTFVTDGKQVFRNDTGNPGMATAGSGDVLTGVITSLVGQGLAPFEAASLGVHIHGIAGDFAAESVGETSLIATDIIDSLPAAFKKYSNASAVPIGFSA